MSIDAHKHLASEMETTALDRPARLRVPTSSTPTDEERMFLRGPVPCRRCQVMLAPKDAFWRGAWTAVAGWHCASCATVIDLKEGA